MPKGQDKPCFTLDADGRAFTITMPGVMAFKGSFSATVVGGVQPRELLSTMGQMALPAGQTQELRSVEGSLVSPVEQTSEETPCGRASVTEATLRFEKGQIDLLFRFSQVPGVPGLQAQAGIRNTGAMSVRLISVTPLALEGRVEGNPAEWLVTPLDTTYRNTPTAVALSELSEPYRVFEYGGFYSDQGSGFLFGPVGTPIAYIKASVAHKGEGNMTLACLADMSGVVVDPDETRWGQQVALFSESPQTALPRWADWVAKTHGADTEKGALSGWTSWASLEEKITGKDVLNIAEAVLESPERLRPDVIQIDSGYEDETGEQEENEKFSDGLKFYAKRIAKTGARPGLFLRYGKSNSAAQILGLENLTNQVQRAVANGFTYLKIWFRQQFETDRD